MLRHIVSNEILTVLLVIGLVIIAIAKLTAPKRFDDFILVLGNDKYLKIYSRDQKFFDKFDALLFANLVLSVSVFCFIAYKLFIKTHTLSSNTMFKLSFSIGVFILIANFIWVIYRIAKGLSCLSDNHPVFPHKPKSKK